MQEYGAEEDDQSGRQPHMDQQQDVSDEMVEAQQVSQYSFDNSFVPAISRQLFIIWRSQILHQRTQSQQCESRLYLRGTLALTTAFSVPLFLTRVGVGICVLLDGGR